MKKFVFIGAGSIGFTRSLVRDILTFDAFKECEIALVDINQERLDFSLRAVKRIIGGFKYNVKVTATMDRAAALNGADGVLITILNGGTDIWRTDIEIPKKYGVDICVGDTRGPSGIFRFLRTAPIMLEICRDIERLCPDAVVLNYTNPMPMLCSYLQRQTKLKVTGLCHSVQGTARMLAEWIGADFDDIEYTCAGINHQAWYLEYKHKGVDATQRIRDAINGSYKIYNSEIVRNEMFLSLDYYVTESSGHNSEYCQWFRKRPDLIEKYCKYGTNWNPGEHAFILKEYQRRDNEWKGDVEEWLKSEPDLKRGVEYAAYIFDAAFGNGNPFKFNGNVQNKGYIDNIIQGACVEIPVIVDKKGFTPQKIGSIPKHLAVINNITAGCEELAVEACMSGDKRAIYHAIINDPLTSAVLSLAEIKSMTDEMFFANRDYLTYFK